MFLYFPKSRGALASPPTHATQVPPAVQLTQSDSENTCVCYLESSSKFEFQVGHSNYNDCRSKRDLIAFILLTLNHLKKETSQQETCLD